MGEIAEMSCISYSVSVCVSGRAFHEQHYV